MDEYVSPPSLTFWGIDEVEANVCEDTFENRQKLTAAKVPFKVFEPGLIEVVFADYEGLNKRHNTQYEAKRDILLNPKDPWGDYLPFDELPLDFMETAPAWIQRHLNKYENAIAEGVPAHKMPILPVRCSRKRADGSRCWAWSWPSEAAKGMCRTHAPEFAFNAVAQQAKLQDAARMRLSQLTEPAMAALEDLVLNSTVPHVRLKAATEVLDRVNIRGGSELSISADVTHHDSPSDAVAQRLQDLADKLVPKAIEGEVEDDDIEIVDVELVEDPAPEDPSS